MYFPMVYVVTGIHEKELKVSLDGALINTPSEWEKAFTPGTTHALEVTYNND